jgi:antitoxin VapB
VARTRVFKNGNSQSVRIPKEYRLEVDEVQIVRVGDSLVLRPLRTGLGRVLELFASLSDEALAERGQPAMQTRDEA